MVKYNERFGLNWLLNRMNLYPNGYYNYKKKRKNAKNKEKVRIQKLIQTLYHECNGIPGYRTMWELLRGKGIQISVQTVRKYMNVDLSLKSITRKKKRQFKKIGEAYAVFANLLEQNFEASKRNEKWCIDFTYTYFSGKKRYNCTIIDLYDRRVVASVNSNRIDTTLAQNTVKEALYKNPKAHDVILHSDRGGQFTSHEFVKFCKENKIKQSMSKPGCPYDNAPMERYFNTLKTELLRVFDYETESSLYSAITQYAYGYYNNLRPHTYNGGLPPAKVA